MSTFHIISTIWAIVALILLAVSWRLASLGKIVLHRNLMILLTLGAWIFVASYLFGQRYSGAVMPFPREYAIWMAFHGTLGLIPLIGATCLIVSRFLARGKVQEGHFNRHHKLYGRIFILLWGFTHLGGIFNAFFL